MSIESKVLKLEALQRGLEESRAQVKIQQNVTKGIVGQIEDLKREIGQELANAKYEDGEVGVFLSDGRFASPRKVTARKLQLDKRNVPVEYQKAVTTIKPDESKIKTALLGGLQVNWASLDDEYYTVVVK